LLDSDHDGIPDAWEITYNFDPHNTADALLDSDGDGLNNLQEFQAGTDPRDPQSVLRLDSISESASSTGTNVLLSFRAVSGRDYSILWKESVDLGKWTKLADVPAPLEDGELAIVDPLPQVANRIYRLVTPQLPGPANPLPAVLSSPKSTVASFGGTAVLSVDAIGSGPLTYEWSLNGTPIPNAVGPLLTITNAQFSDAGLYTVRVTSSGSSDLSSPAGLGVRPRILVQPGNRAASAGNTVSLSVSAQAAGALSYRWRFNGHAMLGQTNSTLSIVNAQPSDSGNYSVVVYHTYAWTTCASVSSNASVIVVNEP
jgi:hypothetical protein